MKTLALLTSGGDSPGMNAALRAAAKTCAARGVRLLGVRDGYEGLIDGRMVEVVPGPCALLGEPGLDVLGGQGGTVLGSARSARFREAAGRARAAEALRTSGVEGLVVIGGNGSLTGAHLLAREHGVRVMGIPASIDNDIGCTALAIGTDTALNTIVQACDHIDDTARAHSRAFVVEVMGRACGYLAMASAVAARSGRGALPRAEAHRGRHRRGRGRGHPAGVRPGQAAGPDHQGRGSRDSLHPARASGRGPAWRAGGPGGGARAPRPRRPPELPRPARVGPARLRGGGGPAGRGDR